MMSSGFLPSRDDRTCGKMTSVFKLHIYLENELLQILKLKFIQIFLFYPKLTHWNNAHKNKNKNPAARQPIQWYQI